MKVVTFNGSPRKDGNSALLIKHVFSELEKENINTELVQLSEGNIKGCAACFKCFENKDNRCVFDGDGINEYIQKMMEADGIIIASPTYFSNVTSEVKAFIDRTGFVGFANQKPYQRKAAAAIAVARRGGASVVLDTINNYFTTMGMVIPGSKNLAIGAEKGDVEKDLEGIRTMHDLGRNMAWLMKSIQK